MRYRSAFAVGIFFVGLLPGNVLAQPSTQTIELSSPGGQTIEVDQFFLLWARNIARGAAEAANGGLGNYYAEAAMHGPPLEAPFVVTDEGTFVFTFKGFHPWEIGPDGVPNYSFETEVVVSPDRTFEVLYNGPIRR